MSDVGSDSMQGISVYASFTSSSF